MERYYDPLIFNQTLDGINLSRHIVATYYVEDAVPGEEFLDHFALIQSMALEGSTGTWEKVEEDSEEVRERLSGKMVGYYPVPSEKKCEESSNTTGFFYRCLAGQHSYDSPFHLRQLFCLFSPDETSRRILS